jgi:fructose-bisphosphate aldolase/6-deoxy-5-ketofructose 1-phosphate synthase
MNAPADVPNSQYNEFLQNYNKITHGTDRLMLFSADQKIEHLNNDFYGDFIHPQAKDPVHIFSIASQGRIGALATHLGLISRYANTFKDINYIVKLNGKTNLIETNNYDPISSMLWSVDDVINFKKNSGLSICGVGYSLYIGSEFESQMLHEAAQIIYNAHQNGLIAILWVYPRGKHLNETNIDLTSGATGIANALGADFVKIKQPEVSLDEIGTCKTLKIATQAAGNTKVICAGGQTEDTEIFLHKLYEQIVIGGASGNATGRNIFQRSLPDAIAFTHAISAIVYDKKTSKEAIQIYNSMVK